MPSNLAAKKTPVKAPALTATPPAIAAKPVIVTKPTIAAKPTSKDANKVAIAIAPKANTTSKPLPVAAKKNSPVQAPSASKGPTKKTTKPSSKDIEVKAEKVKKIKLVRDSFTIPKPEYLVLAALKERALHLKVAVKKGELLRAGIKALESMDDKQLLKAIGAVPSLKTGRPSK